MLLRRVIQLDQPTATRLFITADTRYRLWINGRRVADGSVQSQPYFQYYDEHDVTDHLIAGDNCIAILGYHQGIQPHTRGGVLAEGVDGNGHTLVATDGQWRALACDAWRSDTYLAKMNRAFPFQEHLDLRRLPMDWQHASFDDTQWGRAEVIVTRGRSRPPAVMPWARLAPRDIPMMAERPVYAKSIVAVEECLDLMNRNRSEDLSISLSQAGRSLDWARVDGAEHLLGEAGETIVQCSTRHQDRVTDGRYDPVVVLDFGRVLTGWSDLELEAGANGATVEVGYAERLIDGHFNNAIECQFADCCTFPEGVSRFRPLGWRCFRYLKLRIKRAQAPVRLRTVRAIELTYPFEERGRFASNDQTLNGVFTICRNTLKLCSVEALMDTPQREQAQWLGDVAAVTAPAILAAFGDTAITGKFLRQAAANRQPTGLIANISNVVSASWSGDIPDYSLWWIRFLHEYYQFTGDGRYLHECHDAVTSIMRLHMTALDERGLIADMPGWVFIDWADTDRRGAVAAYNALFAGACDAAAALARVKTDAALADHYAAMARRVRACFEQVFLDPERGVIVDCVEDDERSDQISEHANAAAIAFDCVRPDTADRIIREVFEARSISATETQPFFTVVVLDALRRRGRMDLALQLIRDRWGRRMLDRGYTSCSEEWYTNGSWRRGEWTGFMRTLSHAWSACPAQFLIQRLTGGQILEPGCRRVRLSPYRADFAYSVIWPTPRGGIDVEWDGEQLNTKAPDGVELEIVDNGEP